MNILVTGANGQLGKELQRIVEEKGNGIPDHTTADKNYYIFTGHKELDIANPEAVNDFISKHYINVIVNCAAYTNVNEAEADKGWDEAYRVNAIGTQNLSIAAKQNGCVLIHISTDFVFDGKKKDPHEPSDKANPLSNYGKSKLAGEEFLKQVGGRYLIFRVSWLYSALTKNNFVYKIYDKIVNGKERLNVVDDEVGCPTNARNLANFIYHIIEDNNAENRYLSKTGIYHFCDNGSTNRYIFARYIENLAKECGKCPTAEKKVFPTKTKGNSIRPHYSVLDTKLTTDAFDWEMDDWDISVENTIIEIIEKEKTKKQMRLSKEEFLEIYHEIEKAEEEQEKMQEAMDTLCEASFPIIKDPYEGVFYNLMEKLLDDEFFREFIYGGCTRGYIGDKEYDFSNPEEYYNMLADAEKENKQEQEEKTKE